MKIKHQNWGDFTKSVVRRKSIAPHILDISLSLKSKQTIEAKQNIKEAIPPKKKDMVNTRIESNNVENKY